MKIIVPGLIVFALWSALCVRWYVCGVKELCSQHASAVHETSTEPEADAANTAPPVRPVNEAPLSFEWSNWTPQVGDKFQQYRDSLLQLFDGEPGAKVEITGLYDPQEINNSEFDNLGLARAQAVKDLLITSGIDRSISVNSRIEDLSSGIGEKITKGVIYELQPRINANVFAVERSGSQLTIHYPSNMHKPQSDAVVMNALRSLVQEALRTNSSILVVGHTDNQGESRENKILGLVRATEVKDILMQLGIPESKVLAESEGEDQPIANNNNAQGRYMNRRVELVMI